MPYGQPAGLSVGDPPQRSRDDELATGRYMTRTALPLMIHDCGQYELHEVLSRVAVIELVDVDAVQ